MPAVKLDALFCIQPTGSTPQPAESQAEQLISAIVWYTSDMKRPGRWLFNFAAGVSVVAATSFAMLAVASHFRMVVVSWSSPLNPTPQRNLGGIAYRVCGVSNGWL